jgi:hypothetical protein
VEIGVEEWWAGHTQYMYVLATQTGNKDRDQIRGRDHEED